MNLLKQVYCNQYFELKPKGKGPAARANGTALVTVMLVLYGFSFFFLLMLIFPDSQDFIEDIFEDLFGRRSGKTIGRIIGAVFFGSFYFLIRWTLGREQSFKKTIAKFEALGEKEQQKISKTGLIFFLSSLGVFAVSFGLFLLFS